MTPYLAIIFLGGLSLALGFRRPTDGVGLTWLGGMALVYVGQRLFGDGDGEWPATLAGLVVVAVSVALRARAAATAEGTAKSTQRAALTWQVVGSAALATWWASRPETGAALGLVGDAATRFSVVATALTPIVFLTGLAPMLLVDQALGAHPTRVPTGARRQAVASGLALAFGLALVFPVNYLANEHDKDWDFSYFRVTRPGTATQALVANLETPAEVLLFYPPANEVKERLVPYFEEIAEKSGGKLTVQVLDQPSVPALAKELSIRDNGYVVLKQGDKNQKFKIDPDLGRARRDLKKLDETVQKNLLKLVSEKRVAYFTTGHGEAGPKAEDPFFKLAAFKQLLQAQNYEVKDLGLEQGLATAIPDDAALVIVPAPQKALFDAENEALGKYVAGGGALLVLVDPTRDALPGLLAPLGVAAGAFPLANKTQFVPIKRGLTDRMNLFSQKYGSHAATATLSKYSTRQPVFLPSVVALTETGTGAPAGTKHTALVRTADKTWEEQDGDFEQGAAEPDGTHVVGMAIQGPEAQPFRAVVFGDVSLFADIALAQSDAAQILLMDSIRWLVGEEDIAGEISNEEDVKIEHTQEQDVAWFYSTIFGVPMLVLGVGMLFVRRRATRA